MRVGEVQSPAHRVDRLMSTTTLPEALVADKQERLGKGVRCDEVVFGGQHAKKLSDIQATIEHWVHYQMSTAADSPHQLTHGFTTTTEQLTKALKGQIDAGRPHYQFLLPDDVDHIQERIDTASVNVALKKMNDSGRYTITKLADHQRHIQLAQPATPSPYSDLEGILIENLPQYVGLARQVYHHILDGTYPVGRPIPEKLNFKDKPMGSSTRAKALSLLAQQTGRVALDNHNIRADDQLPHKRYLVMAPGSPLPPPQVQQPFSPWAALVHYFVHHEAFRRSHEVPNNAVFEQHYGPDSAAFKRQKSDMVGRSWLRRQGPYGHVVYSPPNSEQLADAVCQQGRALDRYVDGFLEQRTAADSSKVWKPLNKLVELTPFPDTVPQGNRASWVSRIVQQLEKTPIPVLYKEGEASKLSTWINPALDIEAFNQRLKWIRSQPKILTAGFLVGMPAWQLPTAFEPQVKQKPTVWVQSPPALSDGGGVRVTMGLTSTEYPYAFKPLDQWPVRPSGPPAKPADSSLPKPAFDIQQYGQRCWAQVARIYPLRVLKEASTQSTAVLSESEWGQFRQVMERLTPAGFAMQLAV